MSCLELSITASKAISAPLELVVLSVIKLSTFESVIAESSVFLMTSSKAMVMSELIAILSADFEREQLEGSSYENSINLGASFQPNQDTEYSFSIIGGSSSVFLMTSSKAMVMSELIAIPVSEFAGVKSRFGAVESLLRKPFGNKLVWVVLRKKAPVGAFNLFVAERLIYAKCLIGMELKNCARMYP